MSKKLYFKWTFFKSDKNCYVLITWNEPEKNYHHENISVINSFFQESLGLDFHSFGMKFDHIFYIYFKNVINEKTKLITIFNLMSIYYVYWDVPKTPSL